jgi:hypothetical protein
MMPDFGFHDPDSTGRRNDEVEVEDTAGNEQTV